MAVECKRKRYLPERVETCSMEASVGERHEIGKKNLVCNLLFGCPALGMAQRHRDGVGLGLARVSVNAGNGEGSSPCVEIDTGSDKRGA